MIKEIIGDITQSSTDILVYSTNQNLLLTGGVGMALRNDYGIIIDLELRRNAPPVNEIGKVPLGTIITTSFESNWKVIYHTIVVNKDYHTDPTDVRNILNKVYSDCISHNYKTVSISHLGCGFGDLPRTEFMDILNDIFSDSCIDITVYSKD